MVNFLSMNRVMFTLFGVDVYWYGAIICFAIIVAIAMAVLYCKKRKYQTDMPINIALVILPTGIACGRLFAVLFDADLSVAEYFNFRTGGMSIIGAIIGGGLGLLAFCLITKKKNILLHFDTLCVVLILAQAIGRWGNFINEEVYGQVVTNPAFQFFPFAVEVGGVHYEALFFYEFVLNLIGFIALSIIYLKQKDAGYCVGGYLLYYGIVRTILEPRRNAMYILKASSVKVSLICSILMIVIGASILTMLIIKKYKNKGIKNGKKG